VADVLVELLNRAEVLPDGVFTGRDVRSWPTAEVDRLVSMGILVDAGMANMIVYDDCDHECTIENTGFIEHPKEPGRTVCVHRCMHGCGLVLLEPADFAQWQFSLLGLAEVIARAVGASGSVIEDVPGRIVLVGTVPFRTQTRDIFLAVGLGREDAPAVVASSQRLRESKAPFVLSIGVMPRGRTWPGGMDPAVAVLAEHATLGPFGLALNLAPLFGLETVPHPDADSADWITVTDAANLLLKDLPFLNGDLKKARARVSRAASDDKFKTNGGKGRARLIDTGSFARWRLKQRDADLDEPEIITRGTRYGKMAAGAPARRNIQ
jgi:hypothetical protein